jgi:hypothetical protein
MQVQPIPKAKIRKRRAKNNSRPTENSIREVCGKPYAELHEIFYGPHRQLSIKHGLQAHLCYDHHQGPLGPHKCKARDLELKQQGQIWFERLYGHSEYMRLFGRNYL